MRQCRSDEAGERIPGIYHLPSIRKAYITRLAFCERDPMEDDRIAEKCASADREASIPVLDRFVARLEVSRTYPCPVVSILTFWAGLIALTVVDKVTGTTPVVASRLYAVAWALVVGLELGRDVWVQRHRYASPRWLQALDAAVGHEVTIHALAALIRQHEHELDYVVTRSDLRFEVQAERARRREAARRAEGFRLVEAPVIDAAQVARDEERRRRARERRAARQGRAPA